MHKKVIKFDLYCKNEVYFNVVKTYLVHILNLSCFMRGRIKMKIKILYTNRSEKTKILADEMARWVKTHAEKLNDSANDEVSDLLVIGFDSTLLFKEKKLEEYLYSLDREHVKNIAFFNVYHLTNKQMKKMIKICQERHLPLMREQYTCKIRLGKNKGLDRETIEGARLFIEDMVNIVRDYY